VGAALGEAVGIGVGIAVKEKYIAMGVSYVVLNFAAVLKVTEPRLKSMLVT